MVQRELRATREEVEAAFQAVPEWQVGEILDGELFVSPRPMPRHSNATVAITSALVPPFRYGRGGPGGWLILIEPEIHVGRGPDKLVPDLAGWRRERLTRDDVEKAAIHVAPDWVCEVLSDSTEHLDRGRKRRIYRREKVAHLWFVDPRERTLEVNKLIDGRWLELETYEGDLRVRAEPFDAIELDLATLWEFEL